MTLRRKSLSSYDYPEHLNPFSPEHADNTKDKYFTFGRHRASFRESAINAWNLITTPKRRLRSNSLSSTNRYSVDDPITTPSSSPRRVPPSTPSTSRGSTCGSTPTQIKQNKGESTCSQSEEEKRYLRQGAKPKKKRRAPLPPGPNPAICLQESKQPLASPVGTSSSAESLNEPEICLRSCLATTTLSVAVPKVCITYANADETTARPPLAQEEECDLDPNTDAQPVSPGKQSDPATENIADVPERPSTSLKELINDIITTYPPDDDEDKLEIETISNKDVPAPTIEYLFHSKEYVNTATTTETIGNAGTPTSKITREESNVQAELQVKEDDCIDEHLTSEEIAGIYKGNLLPQRFEESNEQCDMIENSLLAISTSSSSNNVCLQDGLATLEKKLMSNGKPPGLRIENSTDNTSSAMKTDNETSSALTTSVSSGTCVDYTTDGVKTGSVTEGVSSTAAEQNGCIDNGFIIEDHSYRMSSMKTDNKTSSTLTTPDSSGTCVDYTTDNVKTGSVTEGVLPTAEQNGCFANGCVGNDLDSEEEVVSGSPVPPPRFKPHPTQRSKHAMLGKGESKS